jgi:hypothetical protein
VAPTAPGAVGALIFGIVGLLACGFFGIPAIVMGSRARQQIAASGNRYGGDGMALAGVILGWISVGFLALGLVVLFFALVSLGAASAS